MIRSLVVMALVLAACASTSSVETIPYASTRTFGDQLDVGVIYRVILFAHCSTELLVFNGVTWEQTEGELLSRGSGGWDDDVRAFFVNQNEAISPEVYARATLLDEETLRITLPDGSRENRYEPTDREFVPCA